MDFNKSENNKKEENQLIDSGFISSSEISHTQQSSTLSISQTSNHNKQSSLSSSGYYSRLDSTNEIEIEEENSKENWQQYFTQNSEETEELPLHLAASTSDIKTLQKILTLLPHPSLLNIQNNKGNTALHLSCLNNDASITRLLVVAGARRDVKNSNGECAVHICARYGLENCLKAICRGVEVEEFEAVGVRYCYLDFFDGWGLEEVDYEGHTPLHISLLNNNHTPSTTTLQLIFLGVNLQTPELKSGRTPLHLAVEKRDENLIKLLIENGVDVEAENYGGKTAGQVAKINGFFNRFVYSDCDDEDDFCCCREEIDSSDDEE